MNYKENVVIIKTSQKNKYAQSVIDSLKKLKLERKLLYVNEFGANQRPTKTMDVIVYDEDYDREQIATEIKESLHDGEYEAVLIWGDTSRFSLQTASLYENIVFIFMIESLDEIGESREYVTIDLDNILATPLLKRKKRAKEYKTKYSNIAFLAKYPLFD